ncbi:hypothetical protein ACGFZP_16485 [Kitasatospora sp. NPDC048239]|uniref:hypothetical protein n=1 Tax=Kitasatospora sp. NPDC048239 TaxID=3364046 RepID=UPI0037173F13
MTWKRLYLDRMEATALGVLLMCEFGWNLSVISAMPAPKAAPDPGPDGRPTYRVSVRKVRGHRRETENATDASADSPGRLLTQALAATRFARALAHQLAPGTDRLMAWRAHGEQAMRETARRTALGPIRLGLDRNDATLWGKTTGTGSPFRRGRRTVVTERGHALQHTQGVHDRVYVLPDQRVQQQAQPVIAAAADDALQRARSTVALLTADADPGHLPTATADCTGTRAAPVPLPGGGCGASFLLCLACENARIHPGHHPRLAHLHQALTNARSVLSTPRWERDWAQARARLEDLRCQVGERAWTAARRQVTDTDRRIVEALLNGELNP